MRNHNKAVLLRLNESEFLGLKQLSLEHSLRVQEYLRQLIRYCRLPFPVDKKTLRKSLTAR